MLRSNKRLEMEEMDATMIQTAAMLFFLEFTGRFRQEDWSAEEKAEYVEDVLKARGYGNPKVLPALDGEAITATASHFPSGYRAKFGVQDEPQDLFLTGDDHCTITVRRPDAAAETGSAAEQVRTFFAPNA